jgi:PPOX class probable F420-dependent enzyme
MIDLSSELGIRASKRLEQEQVIWLTTVASDGTPQPNPVWFYWDGGSVLVYTTPEAAKLKHIARNGRVALSFEGATVLGGDVIVLNGTASIADHTAEPDPGYLRKYTEAAKEWGRTVESLHEEYSVAIRVTPDRLRGF